MSATETRLIEILMVEDSPSDVLLVRESFDEARVMNKLNVVPDGVEAIAYLRRQGKYSGVRLPDLILLDLNLPRKDGREVLAEIKTDPLLKLIPVVVLTTSNDEGDILKAYGLHANCYITKPVDFDNFSRVVRQIKSFWIGVVALPAGEHHE